MRYYIKAGLGVKVENSWPLPGAIDLQIGAVLTDDDTNPFKPLCGAMQKLDASTERKLESSFQKRPLFDLF